MRISKLYMEATADVEVAPAHLTSHPSALLSQPSASRPALPLKQTLLVNECPISKNKLRWFDTQTIFDAQNIEVILPDNEGALPKINVKAPLR